MLGSRKLKICPKVIKMGSIIGHRIDYNGPAAHTQQKLTQVPPPPPPGGTRRDILKRLT